MNTLTPEELHNWTATGRSFLLVDVREGWERDAFSLGGLHLPLGELMQRRAELPAGVPLVFYCAKGIRSGLACQRLAPLDGFGPVYNLSGGTAAWQQVFGAGSR